MREPPTLVSVVIPARNAAATIVETLAGLAAQTYTAATEIVVVDNGSTDGTSTIVEDAATERGLSVRIIPAIERPGVAYARNAGALAAGGDFIAYCDADDVPAPGWLEALVAAASNADLVGGRLDLEALNAGRSDETPSPEGFPIDALPKPFGFLAYAPSCNFGIWKEALRAAGGWNEAFDSGGEDADLCWRAQLAGNTLAFAPDAVVRFRLRSSTRDIARQAYRDGTTMPHLYAGFAGAGMPRRPLSRAAASWAWIVLAAPTALLPGTRRVRWVRRASQHWGRLVASVRYRVLFL
jgi:glycosyltransferase involved in cell wall biosynthesis